MSKHKEKVLLEVRLRRVEAAAAALAADLERQVYDEEPETEKYDIECGCDELISYINNYRTECEAREAAQHTGDEYAEFRHGKHELI